MDTVKFYMAGGMGGLSIEEQMEWRKDIENKIKRKTNYYQKSTYFFQPPYYYQPDGTAHRS